ncbi:MAG TPA: hypothetical protein VGF10_00770 [Gaiella sp.]|jgi:hypothetical protein
MGLVRDEQAWGTTHEPTPQRESDVREWTVEVESEPLGPYAAEGALWRFADDAAQRAPKSTPTCTLTSGRFGMTLTVVADGADEAARHGRRLFERALETALWPRSGLAAQARFDVVVVPSGDVATAA